MSVAPRPGAGQEIRPILATLDESSYTGGTMEDHPITWCHNYRGGRARYTGPGRTEQSYSDPNVTRMLLGGIRLAAASGR